jgi:hypothetical protein
MDLARGKTGSGPEHGGFDESIAKGILLCIVEFFFSMQREHRVVFL